MAVLTSDDLVNIETGLAVRGVVGDRPVPIVLRVFSRNLARMVGAELDAGLPRSIAELASPWFVGAALGIEVLGTFYVGSTPFMAARLDVRDGGQLEGIAMTDIGRGRASSPSTRPRGRRPRAPAAARPTVLAGDSVYVIGQYDDLLGLLQRA